MASYGETATVTPLIPFQPMLLTEERRTYKCDRCVARSVAVVLIGGAEPALTLEFCGHHLARHIAKLEDRGAEVVHHS